MNETKPITAYDVIVRGHPLPVTRILAPVDPGPFVRLVDRAILALGRLGCAMMVRTVFRGGLEDRNGRRIDPSVTIVSGSVHASGAQELVIVPFRRPAVRIHAIGSGTYVVKDARERSISTSKSGLREAVSDLIAA